MASGPRSSWRILSRCRLAAGESGPSGHHTCALPGRACCPAAEVHLECPHRSWPALASEARLHVQRECREGDILKERQEREQLLGVGHEVQNNTGRFVHGTGNDTERQCSPLIWPMQTSCPLSASLMCILMELWHAFVVLSSSCKVLKRSRRPCWALHASDWQVVSSHLHSLV